MAFPSPQIWEFLLEHARRRWPSLLWSAFGLLTFFPLRTPSKCQTTLLLYESRKLASQDRLRGRLLKWAIINLQWLRYKQGTSWNGAYYLYFENACSRKFHSLCVIHNGISLCKWTCFIQRDCNRFSETDISYACHKCFEWKVVH